MLKRVDTNDCVTNGQQRGVEVVTTVLARKLYIHAHGQSGHHQGQLLVEVVVFVVVLVEVVLVEVDELLVFEAVEEVGTDEVRLEVAVELVRVADVVEEPPPEQAAGTVKSSV